MVDFHRPGHIHITVTKSPLMGSITLTKDIEIPTYAQVGGVGPDIDSDLLKG